ncbi:MAG TPA: DnaJ domain-containing protein [Polyangia bacterium]|nr:DnaJ domain-containing protein [Polyangia bacterium]
MILGVSRAESPGGIRAAYRDLARKLHPDVAGEQATHAFQEVSEAYDILSDPERRRQYNDELQRAEGEEERPVRPAARAPMTRPPQGIFDSYQSIRPSFEAMRDRFARNFTGIGVPRSEHLEGLNVEVVLTPDEARLGCVLPIGVPVFRRCPHCGGSGRDWLFPCWSCQQQGVIESERVVRFGIPALVHSGSIFEMPLQGLGIHNFHLRLHVFVE